MPAEPRSAPRDGFILYAVLSVTALLSVLFLSVSLLTRSAVDTASVSGLDLSADALVQSGINLAGYQLFALQQPGESLNGQQIRLDAGTITMQATPEGGKVDLNGAPPLLLEAAYSAAGLRTLDPAVFAAHVTDWRDPDSDTAKDGAEAAEYDAAGVAFRPRNGTFRQTGDLQWVLGVSAADAKALAPFVTVNNPAGRLDVFAVAPSLLEVMPGMKKDTIEQLLALRASRSEAAVESAQTLLGEQASQFEFGKPAAYRVTIDARVNGLATAKRVEAVLIAAVDKDRPFQIIEWRDR